MPANHKLVATRRNGATHQLSKRCPHRPISSAYIAICKPKPANPPLRQDVTGSYRLLKEPEVVMWRSTSGRIQLYNLYLRFNRRLPKTYLTIQVDGFEGDDSSRFGYDDAVTRRACYYNGVDVLDASAPRSLTAGTIGQLVHVRLVVASTHGGPNVIQTAAHIRGQEPSDSGDMSPGPGWFNSLGC